MKKLTPSWAARVLAVAALFTTLGGPAWAAGVISGARIKNGSITSRKIGRGQIRSRTSGAVLAPPMARAATPTVTASPTSGAPGTPLTISGSGWNPGDTIFVQIGSSAFDTDLACALTADLNGQILGNQTTNNCAVPNVPAGSRTLFAFDEQQQSVNATGAAFTATAGLVLTPAGAGAGSAGSPGATVSIQGHGFAADSTVSGFKLDGAALTTSPASITTDANGSFTGPVTFAVPAATTAGTHTVSASDGAAHTASQSLNIFAATVSVSPTSGTPGTPLILSGSGWPAHDTIFVQIGSSAFDSDVACFLTVLPNGQISGDQTSSNCVIPNVPAGSQVLTAIDEQSQGVIAKGTSFTVKSGLVLTPLNGAAGSPASPGATVSMIGHGFAPSSTVSKFTLDGAPLTTTPASVATDASGNFTGPVSFAVPSGATAGTHTVAATDAASNTGTQGLKLFAPKLSVSPTSGTPGTGLTVSGSGWSAHDTIVVQIGSSAFDSDVACFLTALPNGQISGDQTSNNCVVPNVPAGSQVLTAIDEQSQGVIGKGTSFTVKSGLVLTPLNGAAGGAASPGATVSILGHGFAAATTASTFKFDTTALTTTPTSISTDASGSFTGPVSFLVPSAATTGNHTVSATDAANHTGSATLQIFRPTVSVSPTSGAPGTGLTVSGSGWPALDTIFVQIGSSVFDTDVVCSLTANLNGQIVGNKTTNNCQVPNVGVGSQPLVAIDGQHQGVQKTGASFNVT